MDLTLVPLVDSDTTALDFDEVETPANAPRRVLAIDLHSGLEVGVEVSGNGESQGGGYGDSVQVDMSNDNNGYGDYLINDDDYDEDFNTPVENAEISPAMDLSEGLQPAVEVSGNGGGVGGSGNVNMPNSNNSNSNILVNNDANHGNFHTPIRNSTRFVASDSDSDLELELAMELAVDAAGNGGGGGGGSGNVVCADMSDDDYDDDDDSINPWTREDAISRLNAEFCMHHPDRCVEPDHPQHDLYMRVLGLINKYYDEIDSEGESNMADEVIDRVKNARIAFQRGGFSMEGRHWTEILPYRAKLLFAHFVHSHDAIEGSIADMLKDMGCIRLLSIGG